MTPLILTAGEPAGIGPDLCVQWASYPRTHPVVVAADPVLLMQRAEMLGAPLTIELYEPGQPVHTEPDKLTVAAHSLAQPVVASELNPANAEYVLNTLRYAVNGCRNGDFSGMVTGPVHKGLINDAGIHFTGHTEFLAERCHTEQVVMMLATPGLRVALATTHLPLSAVSEAITMDSLTRTIQIIQQAMVERFGYSAPRIGVCGLNPHAGEDGHLGMEEIEVINPVLDGLRASGLDLIGPIPADTAFTPSHLEQFDVVLAMYHDQGLPVLKHKGFGNAVNVTLGLPIIRTSVDHGTALHLAGKGGANTGSLQYAIEVALEMGAGSP